MRTLTIACLATLLFTTAGCGVAEVGEGSQTVLDVDAGEGGDDRPGDDASDDQADDRGGDDEVDAGTDGTGDDADGTGDDANDDDGHDDVGQNLCRASINGREIECVDGECVCRVDGVEVGTCTADDPESACSSPGNCCGF